MVELSGTYQVPAARETVYAALQDPDVLRRCIEGCDQLTETEPGVYDAQLRLGLGAIRGRYTGRARVRDTHPPESFTLAVEGKGPGGHVRGDARLVLADAGSSTSIACQATGDVAGALAAVGSRLIQAAAARLIERFFSRLAEIVGRPPGPCD
jgi:carbon monoxide dehydrogenase subunit G